MQLRRAMPARLLCLLLLSGCFTARTHADRPRALAYNALTVVGGVAAGLLGLELARASNTWSDSDGEDVYLPAILGELAGGAGIVGGSLMVFGGLAGLALTELDFVPVR